MMMRMMQMATMCCSSLKTTVCYCACFAFLVLINAPSVNNELMEIPHQEVENWAWRFGRHLYELSRKITYVDEISAKYASAKIEKVDGKKLVKEMVDDIEKFMNWKIQAVQRIADTAEEAVKGYEYVENLKYKYASAKDPPDNLTLSPNKRFDNVAVCTNQSTVHVATNVYDENPEVINAIRASKLLDPTFMGNYQHDPKSLWQYFGSSKGFLRHFPGIKWPKDPSGALDENAADTYDCRMRPWYIEAASSPKDLVILLDISGSMTGLRYEIARHVVVNILETLNHNDYVAVYKFSTDTTNVVPCFGDTLVPAYKENLELIKDAITDIKLENMSEFNIALETAFEVLAKHNHSGEGSQCNQAIMLVADGAPNTYEEIFLRYYEKNRKIRMFTYLIGREVTEEEEMKWMACRHRGYFSHVTTLAEVREQVEKYIPVMARPLALEREHMYIWTPVYADIADPKIARWLFEIREKRLRKQRLLRKKHIYQLHGDDIFQSDDESQSEEAQLLEAELLQEDEMNANEKREVYETMEHFELMTSVAVPVFNQCNVQVITRIEINGTMTEVEETTRKAELLGVAGTDVPIKQILKLAPPYKIGVNGYPFIVSNNGHLLTHPRLRPFYKKLLKIGYSNVDLSDVELGDVNLAPWERDQTIMELRKEMINRRTNYTTARVKFQFDNAKRVSTRQNIYFFAPIDKTPYTFGLALPHPYGTNRVKAALEIKSANVNLITLFEGNKWRVHPHWVYCEYDYPHHDLTPEENLLHFLSHIQGQKREYVKHIMERVSDPLPWDANVNQKDEGKSKDNYYCDRDLLHSLLFDAQITDVFGKQRSFSADSQGQNDAGFARKNGVVITFVATRSGLTRWEDLIPEEELGNQTDPHFIYMHNKAIDEVWYKRAVEHNLVNNTTFVFSVPFEAYRKNDTYVTGSHAIFVQGPDGSMAPAAVVGLQFKHSTFMETFLNMTSDCTTRNCNVNCSSEDLDCYLLDDSGFVIVSEDKHHTGKFFGEIDGLIMHSLIVDGIYQGVHMYDYQGSCTVRRDSINAGSIISLPIQYVTATATWFFKKLSLLWIQYNIYSWLDLSWLKAWATSNIEDANELHRHMDEEESIHYTLNPCTTNFTLYRLNISQQKMKPLKAKLSKCNPNGCDRPFSVQQVPYTNLILLAVDATCPCESSQTTSIEPSEINYSLNNMTRCQMLKIRPYRAHPKNKCFNYHPDEVKIKDCGRGIVARAEIVLILFSSVLTILFSQMTEQTHTCS